MIYKNGATHTNVEVFEDKTLYLIVCLLGDSSGDNIDELNMCARPIDAHTLAC